MVEQVGSVFIENSQGYLQCPNFSDIIIRNPIDFSPQPVGGAWINSGSEYSTEELSWLFITYRRYWSFNGRRRCRKMVGWVNIFKILGRAKNLN